MVVKSKTINTSLILEDMKVVMRSFRNSFGIKFQLFVGFWWIGICEAWHDKFVKEFVLAQEIAFKEKIKMTEKVLNFTEREIPEDTLRILSKDMKYKPHFVENFDVAQRNFNEDFMNQAIWYSKHIEGRSFLISQKDQSYFDSKADFV